MRNLVGLTLLVAAATTAPPSPPRAQPARPPQAEETIREVGAEYLKALTAESPSLALKQGLPLSRLPDVSLAGAEARAQHARRLLERLESLAAAPLGEEDGLSSEVLKRRLRFDAEAPRAYWLGFDVTPYASPLGDVHAAFRAAPLQDKADADRYLALLSKYPAFVDDVRARLLGQAEHGVRVPKDELATARAFLSGATGPSGPFAVDDARLSALAPTDSSAFRQSLPPSPPRPRVPCWTSLRSSTIATPPRRRTRWASPNIRGAALGTRRW